MQVATYRPGERLAPFVDRFTVVETTAEATRVLLPEAGLVLGVRYRGGASLVERGRATRVAGASLTGLQGAARRMRTHPDSGVVLAHFRTAAAAAFFASPLDELRGRTLGLAAILPRAEVERLSERVAGQPDAAGRVRALEAYLLSRLGARPIDPIAAAAARAIEASHGALRIAALADRLGVGQDHLEKRFRRAIGATPKQLACLLRVRRAIEIGRRGGTWSRVAHEAGYFDQSHLIRDFRAVTGEAPARFFGGAAFC